MKEERSQRERMVTALEVRVMQLPALKKEVISQRLQVTSANQKRQENVFSPSVSRRNTVLPIDPFLVAR